MRKIPALILASACLLSGCASRPPLLMTVDRDGEPIARNISGTSLQEISFRAVSVTKDGRSAVIDKKLDHGLESQDVITLPELKMEGVLAIVELRGTHSKGKLKCQWTNNELKTRTLQIWPNFPHGRPVYIDLPN